jgi:hypothetical protein
LAAKRAELGNESDAPYEREEVHAVLGERIEEEVSGPEGVAPATIPAAGSDLGGDIPSWQNPALATQVQQLVDLAFSRGVGPAIQAATKTNNAELIDAFHDLLADELHRELLERGKIAPAA